jgi:hypothetical protein
MPKQRPPFDLPRYETLKAQGLSQRVIAEQMGMPESTLRDNINVLKKRQEQGPPMVSQGTPPLYVHPGIPDDSEESPVGPEHIEGVHEGMPALPLAGIQEDHQGPPSGALSPDLVETLVTAWPELQQLLAWWRTRQQAQGSAEKLERVTYHVAPKWREAVRREADLTGESYAAVVNRAFATYFGAKAT